MTAGGAAATVEHHPNNTEPFPDTPHPRLDSFDYDNTPTTTNATTTTPASPSVLDVDFIFRRIKREAKKLIALFVLGVVTALFTAVFSLTRQETTGSGGGGARVGNNTQ